MYKKMFKLYSIYIIVLVACSVRFDIQPGREGFVDFKSGQESMVYRAKNGHLMVVSVEVIKRLHLDNVKLYFMHIYTLYFFSVGIYENQVQIMLPVIQADDAVTAMFDLVLLHGCCQ